MSDRAFVIAFSCSLAAHLLLLGANFVHPSWKRHERMRRALMQVVYEHQAAEREVERLRRQIEQAKQSAAAAPRPSQPGGAARIRIADRPAVMPEGMTSAEMVAARGNLIDLTNLVEAVQGDPVLLSYFGAVREQIQREASENQWSLEVPEQGVVYISFLLSPKGAIDRVEVVSGRSALSRILQDAALKIVSASAPFPAFPPSMGTASKTVIVPLEFLIGS